MDAPPIARLREQEESRYIWTFNLAWKLLRNDPATLGLFAGNPFPDRPPRYVRFILYVYHFVPPGNPGHVYWTRDRLGLWLGPYSADDPQLLEILRAEHWIP